ncbi:MAG: cytochrome-c peroxidase [Betaproteobacteria bacterium]|nr:cytochrome-c peroxidase [Betaproteobacteria bacterium]
MLKHETDSGLRLRRSGWWLAALVVSAALSALIAARATAQGVPPGPPPPGPQVLAPAPLSRIEDLGRQIFNDRNLSEPRGTACADCHVPARGFAGNNGSRIGVALGSKPDSLGGRNAMSNAYTAFIPPFSFRVKDGDVDPVGGLFWDGRADTAAQQALGPLLNPLEMNNANVAAVVRKIAAAPYAQQFRDEFGANIFRTPDAAFAKVGEAIAAFEKTPALQPFSSKYDQVIQGKAQFSAREANGMRVFMDPAKGNCASCHVMNPKSPNPRDSMFSDWAHYNTGVPRNPEIPRNANPSFFDLGVCGPDRTRPALGANVPADVSLDKFCGAFRMVTLRNVADRTAWMHNGVFKSLRDVVSFYATRNSDPVRWYGPAGVPNDVPLAYRGNVISDRVPFNRPANAGPALTEREIDDVVAFLRTLSDAPAPAAPPVPPPAPGAGLNPFR